MKKSFWLVAIVAGLFAGGCQLLAPKPPDQTMTGTLHSVRPAGGGAPTGWVLSQDMMGMSSGGMALDVSAVEGDAEKLDGKQVQITATPPTGGSQKMVVKSIGEISK